MSVICDFMHLPFIPLSSSVARAFPGGRVAHPEGQIEEENEKILRKNESNWLNIEEKWGKWKSCPPGTGRLATALPLSLKEYYKISWRKRPQFKKKNLILSWLYPVKDSAERGLVLSKYIGSFDFGGFLINETGPQLLIFCCITS